MGAADGATSAVELDGAATDDSRVQDVDTVIFADLSIDLSSMDQVQQTALGLMGASSGLGVAGSVEEEARVETKLGHELDGAVEDAVRRELLHAEM